MKTKKELDKFYTHPDIAKEFVEKINSFKSLGDFDLVIEPSAGSGNILQFLPESAIGFDTHPESDRILTQDFFEYEPPSRELSIACIGNPPFGSGYMNPLAKGFFNHAAQWSEVIAFIVPSKWHTSWKVQGQLDKKFKLYYSEILPKKSFLLDNKPYDVNCCMQIWTKKPIDNNLRIQTRPPTSHPDFDFFLTCDKVPRRRKVIEQLQNQEYWDFGLKYWGRIETCDIKTVPPNTTTHYLFKANKDYVKSVIESIDWKKYISNMGAPNVGGKSILVKAYTERKEEMGL